MRWRSFLAKLLIVSMLVIMGGQAAMASPGAIWTTTADGEVNANQYDYKEDVYLNGGPMNDSGGDGLPDGWYYVKVTTPDGALLGYNDAPVLEVVDGRVVTNICLWDNLYKASDGTQGYDTTTNSGGVYKVWASLDPDFNNADSKTDNFKVDFHPGIEIVKEADPASVTVGETITYTYTVTNTGDVTLTGVAVDDNKLGPITLEEDTLEPGASTTGTATYVATSADIGDLVNVAVATGYGLGGTVEDSDEATVAVSAPQVGEPCERYVKVIVNGLLGTDTADVTLGEYGTQTLSDAANNYTYQVADGPEAAEYTAAISVPAGYVLTNTEPADGKAVFDEGECNLTKEVVFTLTKQTDPGDPGECKRYVTIIVNGLRGNSTASVWLAGNPENAVDVSREANSFTFSVADGPAAADYEAAIDVPSGYYLVSTSPGNRKAVFAEEECGTKVVTFTLNRRGGGGGGGDGDGGGPVDDDNDVTQPEPVVVPPEPPVGAPQEPPVDVPPVTPVTPTPAPVPEPVVVPDTPAGAPPDLPFTGGNPLLFVSAGMAMSGLGIVLRRKFR